MEEWKGPSSLSFKPAMQCDRSKCPVPDHCVAAGSCCSRDHKDGDDCKKAVKYLERVRKLMSGNDERERLVKELLRVQNEQQE